MKKKNKIIAIIVTLILVVSVFVVGTVANTKNTSIAISIDKTELTAGQSATVTVTASADYPVATASIPVFYDKTMVTVSNATATITGYAVAEVTTDLTAVDSAKIYANTNMNSEKYGFVLVTYIGGANDTVSTIDNKTVLTFTITAKSDVSGDALVKCVTDSAKTDDNVEGMLYFGATTSGTTITSIPENVENINVSSTNVNISNGKNTLTLNENAPFEAIVDLENNIGGEYTGTVYGFDTLGWNDAYEVDGTIADFLSTAYGDDYLEITEADGGETTGTVINVLDDNGEVVESYVYIYFGDVNGDGLVDNGDSVYMDTYGLVFEGIDDLIQMMSADVNGDGIIDNADSVYTDTYGLMFEGMPTQMEIAEMAVSNFYEFW